MLPVVLTVLLRVFASSSAAPQTTLPPGHQLIVCGAEELYILDASTPTPTKVWSWRAANRPELPEDMRKRFQTIDECKPVDGGKRILITASSNGAAVLERATGRVEFYALSMNAHSIELLPGNRVVVAASHVTTGPGDRLSVYDLARPNVEVFHVDTPWPHAVVWDEARKTLWADSQVDVVGYSLADWDTATPRFGRDVVVTLPDNNGHDMMPVPGSSLMTLTAQNHTWLFDRDTRAFQRHPELGEYPGVKSVHVHPQSTRAVWILSEGGNWWSDKLRFLNPEGIVQLPGEKIYKARWMPTPAASAAWSTSR